MTGSARRPDRTVVPDQTGRALVVTGANSGLGRQMALVLARHGARVLMACRDAERGRAAVAAVAEQASGPTPELVMLDVADLASVRAAAADIRQRTGDRLDVLVNNAGVMGTPRRSTVDGFELQIGTNHLGPAALTWLLAPALVPGARVVTVSSLAHRGGALDPDDLFWTRRRYSLSGAYSASKLANLVFTAELDRRATAAGRDLVAVAAHPGLTDTELFSNSVAMRASALRTASKLLNKVITQGVAAGTLPQLHATVGDDVVGGDYFGPSLLGETRGAPARAARSRAALDPVLGVALWERTAELTGVTPDPA